MLAGHGLPLLCQSHASNDNRGLQKRNPALALELGRGGGVNRAPASLLWLLSFCFPVPSPQLGLCQTEKQENIRPPNSFRCLSLKMAPCAMGRSRPELRGASLPLRFSLTQYHFLACQAEALGSWHAGSKHNYAIEQRSCCHLRAGRD